MNTSLPKFIGITELRNKMRDVFDMVRKKEALVVVMRDSRPEAVIIPYDEYSLLEQEKMKMWNRRIDELAKETKPYLDRWLKKKGFNPQKITGDKLLEILEEDDNAGSH